MPDSVRNSAPPPVASAMLVCELVMDDASVETALLVNFDHFSSPSPENHLHRCSQRRHHLDRALQDAPPLTPSAQLHDDDLLATDDAGHDGGRIEPGDTDVTPVAASTMVSVAVLIVSPTKIVLRACRRRAEPRRVAFRTGDVICSRRIFPAMTRV